jgi:AcrR family transcriptional regulator
MLAGIIFQCMEAYTTHMSEAVKSGKGRRRQAQAEATRLEIVEAARRLFLERGYVGTTIESIADEAGVAVQTIYNSIGSKRDVLAKVLDHTVAGPRAPATVPEFMRERTRAVADAPGVVRLLAEWFAEGVPRAAPILKVIAEAAAVDPEAAALDAERARQRLGNYMEAARELARRGGLRRGLTAEAAAAIIWSVGHPSTYRLLVEQERWSLPRYRRWVESTLSSALLP